jgi:hypothetical protein
MEKQREDPSERGGRHKALSHGVAVRSCSSASSVSASSDLPRKPEELENESQGESNMALKPEELSAFRKTFLPPPYYGPPTPKTAKPPPPSSTHPLNQYGFNLMTLVEKEYNQRVEVWKKAFRDVVEGLAMAITQKNVVLQAAQAERQADAEAAAALNGMVLSVISIGSMSFLGAWVEHSLAPSFMKLTHVEDDLIMGLKTNAPFIVKSTKPVHVQRFSALQADAFGGIAQGIGGQVLPLVFPKPTVANFKLDSQAGVESLRNSFFDFVDESASVVVKQFTNVETWMNETTEFGEAWAKFGGADAKNKIRLHFDGLRNAWAKKWKLFGTNPVPLSKQMLAATIERALWAGYLALALSDPKFSKGPTYTEEAAEAWLGYRSNLGKVLENTVLKRLKDLNVVKEETIRGLAIQLGHERDPNIGAPAPTVSVKDEVDTREEVAGLRAWAEDYLNNLDKEAQLRFFPPARPRAIEPIQYV